jgi:hypothetical protein
MGLLDCLDWLHVGVCHDRRDGLYVSALEYTFRLYVVADGLRARQGSNLRRPIPLGVRICAAQRSEVRQLHSR